MTENSLIEVEQAEREIVEILRRADAAAYDRAVADDWAVIDPRGQVVTKAQMMAALVQGDLEVESFEADEVEVRLYGEVAVVTGRASLKLKGDDPKPAALPGGRYRYTDVLVKRQGSWQFVATQQTALAEDFLE